MIRTISISGKNHARLTRLKKSGSIESMSAFVDGLIDEALKGLVAPPEPKESVIKDSDAITITIKIGGSKGVIATD